MTKHVTIFAGLILLFQATGKAQGCSDAGFCTIGHLGLHTNIQKNQENTLKLALTSGVGDEDVFVFTPAIEYNRKFNPRWSGQVRVTANHAAGNLGTAVGAGDVYISGIYALPSEKVWQVSFTSGAKLPLNQSNLKENNRSLPMQYQSSLGTVDLILGVTLQSPRWQLAAGWQQPLTGTNGNQFLPQYWPDGKAMNYPPTNDFNRRGDVLLRTNYLLVLNKKCSLNGGLLGIYHLGQDTYIDANMQNEPIPIEGSNGLTLNATALLLYNISDRLELGLTGGVPLVIRDVRPDGLTRSFVLSPQINYKF